MIRDLLVEPTYLNRVIRGKIQFRKCPSCDIDGIELQRYNSETGEPCDPEDPDRMEPEPCRDCDGIGFIEIPN